MEILCDADKDAGRIADCRCDPRIKALAQFGTTVSHKMSAIADAIQRAYRSVLRDRAAFTMI